MSTSLTKAQHEFYWKNCVAADSHDFKFNDLKGNSHDFTFHEFSKQVLQEFVTDVYAHSLLERDEQDQPKRHPNGEPMRKSFKQVAEELDEKLYVWFAKATQNKKEESYFKSLVDEDRITFGQFAFMIEVIHVINHIEEIVATEGNWAALREARMVVHLDEKARAQEQPPEISSPSA